LLSRRLNTTNVDSVPTGDKKQRRLRFNEKQHSPQTKAKIHIVAVRIGTDINLNKNMKTLHKNSQKRYYEDRAIYFITCKTYDSFPYFEEETFCDLWIEELKICQNFQNFQIHSFCLLYDHFHLLIQPSEEANISQIIKSLKRDFSINANKILGINKFNNCTPSKSAKLSPKNEGAKLFSRRIEAQNNDWHHNLDNLFSPHLKNTNEINKSTRPGEKAIFRLRRRKRFEREILKPLQTKFQKKHPKKFTYPKFKWQKSFHDHIIRNEKDFKSHYQYCTYNYLKHELPKD